MLNINIHTPSSILELLREKYKQKRLLLNLTQRGLAIRSGVSLGSVKRFESSGKISLESLLKVSLVLECLDDFNNIANIKIQKIDSIEQLLNSKEPHIKKRGSIV
ncbi:helix-turn-helix transcriptional regulator [Candidatus Woesearchaeota archaeon]|nr:helix-turn-helix transcriptional regulator [Candidatus Woesearchaeota archaeon]